MKFELRKNHQGAQKIFALGKTTAYEALLQGEETPYMYPYLVASVEAASWLEAKRLFALPLSEIQTKLADGTITHFELYGRHAPEVLSQQTRSKP